MTDHGFFEVDTDDLRARGSGMLGAGDAVDVTASRGALHAYAQYGDGQLAGASDRFGDRYSYLLRRIGEALITEGHNMRGSAFGYDEADAMAAAAQNQLAVDWP